MTTDWCDGLSEFDGTGLAEFPDNLLPLTDEPAGQDLDDASQDKVKGLDADLAFRAHRRNVFVDMQQIKAAKDHITKLPGAGEAVHMVVSGRYPLFAIVPAVLELAGTTIDELHLVTLSYSRDNAADLLDLIDAGQVKRVWLLVSHYFSNANANLYDPLASELNKRGHQVLAMRNHAKVILMKLTDGRKLVVHASANLRSCKNIEQACFENDPDLYDFHRRWVDGLFAKAAVAA